jgi:hypothetical protein
MEQHAYILYVAGNSDLAARALANFDRIVRAGRILFFEDRGYTP